MSTLSNDIMVSLPTGSQILIGVLKFLLDQSLDFTFNLRTRKSKYTAEEYNKQVSEAINRTFIINQLFNISNQASELCRIGAQQHRTGECSTSSQPGNNTE